MTRIRHFHDLMLSYFGHPLIHLIAHITNMSLAQGLVVVAALVVWVDVVARAVAVAAAAVAVVAAVVVVAVADAVVADVQAVVGAVPTTHAAVGDVGGVDAVDVVDVVDVGGVVVGAAAVADVDVVCKTIALVESSWELSFFSSKTGCKDAKLR